MASRDLHAAREAYESGDIERSRIAHERRSLLTSSGSRGTVDSASASLSSSSSSSSSSSPSVLSPLSPLVPESKGLSIAANPSNPLLSSSSVDTVSSSSSSSSSLSSSSSSPPNFRSSSMPSTMDLHSPIANNTPSMCEPGHQTDTPFGKSFISGALDGASTAVILVIIFSILPIDYSYIIRILYSIGISLSIAYSLREYMKSTWDYMIYERERKREAWELENFPDGERREMIELYVSHGVSLPDAVQVIKTLSSYPDFFVSLMMAQELRMAQPESTPGNLAIANFVGFNLFYFIPLSIVYLYYNFLASWLPIDASSSASSSSPLLHIPGLLWVWSLPTLYPTVIPSLSPTTILSFFSSTDIRSFVAVLLLHIPPSIIVGSIFILVWYFFHVLRITTLPIYKHTNTSMNIGTTGIIAATVAGLLAYGISPLLDLRNE